MKEELISFETAKLTKEIGFDEATYKWYYHTYGLNGKGGSSTMGEDFLFHHSKRGKLYYPAPTQSLLQKWLREKHGVFVWLKPKWSVYIDEHHLITEKDCYEEALEIGLQKALKIIKSKMKNENKRRNKTNKWY